MRLTKTLQGMRSGQAQASFARSRTDDLPRALPATQVVPLKTGFEGPGAAREEGWSRRSESNGRPAHYEMAMGVRKISELARRERKGAATRTAPTAKTASPRHQIQRGV